MTRRTINLVDKEGNSVPRNGTSAHIKEFFANIGEKLANNIRPSAWSYDGRVCEGSLDEMSVN